MPGLKLGLVIWETSRLIVLTETSAKCMISLGEYSEFSFL
jgi:hypothetical protein